MANKRTIVPLECSKLKDGEKTENGKRFKWSLYKISAVVQPSQVKQVFTSFYDFSPYINQEVEVEIEKVLTEKDGKTYENYTIKLPKLNVKEEIRELKRRVKEIENRLNII